MMGKRLSLDEAADGVADALGDFLDCDTGDTYDDGSPACWTGGVLLMGRDAERVLWKLETNQGDFLVEVRKAPPEPLPMAGDLFDGVK